MGPTTNLRNLAGSLVMDNTTHKVPQHAKAQMSPNSNPTS